MRGVQVGGLEHGEARLVERAALELIALLGGAKVLHHQDEFAGRGIDIGEIAFGRRDHRGGREVLIEIHLTDVIAERDAGSATLIARRGKFADQRSGRVRAALRVVERELDALADLAGADGFGGEAGHPRIDTAGAQHGCEPVRRDGFGAQNRDHQLAGS